MKKLNYYVIGAIKRGMADLLDNRDIEIDWNCEYLEKYEAKINWCALGSVSSIEAKEFAKKMMLSVEMADVLNSYDIYETFSDEEGNPSKEELLEIRNNIKKYGRENFHFIIDWIIKKYGVEA